MARLWVLLLLTAGATACGDLDNVDYVHDMRMLAARADPPGQLVDQNALIAGAASGASSTTPVTVTVLVADPVGGGRVLDYTWTTCAALDTNSQRCLPTGAGYTVLSTGSSTTTNGYAEISTVVTPSDALLVQATKLDSFHAFDGLFFPVQLSVQAGSDHATGVKLITYTPPSPGITYTPPTNPNIQGVNVESTAWPTAGFTFSTGTQPKDGWDIDPVFDANAQVAYQIPSFQGDPLDFTESWMFDFFTTLAAGFSPTSTGGVTLANNVENPVDSKWNPGKTSDTKTGLFTIVVRSGRGGENWVILPATWTP